MDNIVVYKAFLASCRSLDICTTSFIGGTGGTVIGSRSVFALL